jgi:hypothetical protein
VSHDYKTAFPRESKPPLPHGRGSERQHAIALWRVCRWATGRSGIEEAAEAGGDAGGAAELAFPDDEDAPAEAAELAAGAAVAK